MDHPERPVPDSTVFIRRLREVTDVTPEELDNLPFGVIKVDKTGVVLAYNAAEAQLAGKNPADVIGRHFFTDVAPCTNVEQFAARFHRGIASGRLREVFPFTFTFPKGPVLVLITLLHERDDEYVWIFVESSRTETAAGGSTDG